VTRIKRRVAHAASAAVMAATAAPFLLYVCAVYVYVNTEPEAWVR